MTCNNTVTLRDKLLPMVNKLRALPTNFGLRLYTVTVRVTTWSGTPDDVPGQGVPTIVDTPIVLDGYGGRILPKVTLLTTRDIVASNYLYADGDYKIDYMTPQYINIACDGYVSIQGVPVSEFDVPVNSPPTEVNYILTGPEFPNGALFKKIQTYTYKPFDYSFVVRKIGVP